MKLTWFDVPYYNALNSVSKTLKKTTSFSSTWIIYRSAHGSGRVRRQYHSFKAADSRSTEGAQARVSTGHIVRLSIYGHRANLISLCLFGALQPYRRDETPRRFVRLRDVAIKAEERLSLTLQWLPDDTSGCGDIRRLQTGGRVWLLQLCGCTALLCGYAELRIICSPSVTGHVGSRVASQRVWGAHNAEQRSPNRTPTHELRRRLRRSAQTQAQGKEHRSVRRNSEYNATIYDRCLPTK